MIICWNIGYTKAKEKAHKIYKDIGVVQCPVFNDESISFNNKGFNHLIRKGRIPRTKNEQKKRFRLIEYAEEIVKNPTSRLKMEFEEREVTEKVNRFGKKILMKKKSKAWTFIENINGSVVKVVIIQIEGRNKEFLSIMSKDIKINTPNHKLKNSSKVNLRNVLMWLLTINYTVDRV